MNKKYLPHLWCWPWNVFAWVAILTMWALFGTRLRWEEGCLVFNLKADSWFYKKFYTEWGGTTMGHGIMYSPTILPTSSVIVHEHVHVEQFEGAMLQAAMTALVVFIVTSLAGDMGAAAVLAMLIWVTGGAIRVLGYSLSALIKGGDFYRDAQHERAARAITKIVKSGENV